MKKTFISLSLLILLITSSCTNYLQSVNCDCYTKSKVELSTKDKKIEEKENKHFKKFSTVVVLLTIGTFLL